MNQLASYVGQFSPVLFVTRLVDIYILKAIKNATGTIVVFPVNISFIHYVLVLTSVPNIGERFAKT